uniref:Dermacentor 9 kDa family member n=1 Tax=Rhipicephalus appendiculatus TaxID=34631 RepID=A0A131Z4D8_RHIAP
MNGKIVTFCSVLVFVVLIKTTAEHVEEPGPTDGISIPKVVMEVLQSYDQSKQTKTKGSSSGILCHGKTHLCYEVPRENCTCVPFTMKCPPENMVIECPKGGNQNCQMIRGRESSCRCVCDAQ